MFKKLFRKSTGSDGRKSTGSDGDSPGKEVSDTTHASPGKLAGIGIVFQLAPDGGLYIKNMSPDGAAHESGILQQGDCLISVDSVNVFGKGTDFVTGKIMGKVGTPVATKFRRNVVMNDGSCQFRYVAPVLTRGKAADLPQPAGVGIIFKVGQDKGMYVKSISPDGPAGLSQQVFLEDCLMAVDGRNVHQQPVTNVTPLLTGNFGSEVTLGLRRNDGKMVNVTLTRGKRATFRDEATPLMQQGITTKAYTHTHSQTYFVQESYSVVM
jgi:C-terminal processing protease CtpA/Prc